MNLQLSHDEADILLELLERDFKQLEIDTLRTDKIDYHRMLQKRTEILDGVIDRLKNLRATAATPDVS